MITGKRFKFILLTFIFAAGLFFTQDDRFFSQAGVLFAQDKPDALKLYRQGRSLDSIGRREDARTAYLSAIEICRNELKVNSKNMNSYAVYTWCLFRLGRYKDTELVCSDALKIGRDARIIETLAEAQFFLGNYKDSLRNMEMYIEMAPNGERISVAHFFVGEIYRNTKKYHKADIAYSISVHLEPSNSLWWYRLGIVREAAGEKEGAIAAYQTAVRLRPEFKEAAEALKRVKI